MARIGKDVSKICPQIKDRDDEEEVQKLFCFIFAEVKDDNTFRRMEVLETESFVTNLFANLNSNSCLLLHTKEQDHQLETVCLTTPSGNISCTTSHTSLCKLEDVISPGSENMDDHSTGKSGTSDSN